MKRGQAAIEYILLVGMGLFVLTIAFALAYYVHTFSSSTLVDVAASRNESIAMLVG